MGRAYKLQCKECGAQFIHSADSSYGVQIGCVGCGESVATQSVIKCPGCRHLLNASEDEFRRQIVEEIFWE